MNQVTQSTILLMKTRGRVAVVKRDPGLTFGAAYPHHSLEADLAGEVPLEVLLEALHLGGVMLVVVGGVVVHAPCRVPGYASCRGEGAYVQISHVITSCICMGFCAFMDKLRDGKDRKVG